LRFVENKRPSKLFLLSFAKLLSWRNDFLESGTTGLLGRRRGIRSQLVHEKEDVHLEFLWKKASKNKF
jgi:hypothetical protein